MAVQDYIVPLEHHSLCFPSQLLQHVKNLSKKSPKNIIDLTEETYDKLVDLIDRGLAGRGVKLEEEEKAAQYVSHLIIDAAFLHNSLCHAGIIKEKFPYDYLVDKILPKKETEQ